MACARTFTTEERDENNIIIRYAGEVTASTTPENTAGASNDDVVGAIGTAKVNLGEKMERLDR